MQQRLVHIVRISVEQSGEASEYENLHDHPQGERIEPVLGIAIAPALGIEVEELVLARIVEPARLPVRFLLLSKVGHDPIGLRNRVVVSPIQVNFDAASLSAEISEPPVKNLCTERIFGMSAVG